MRKLTSFLTALTVGAFILPHVSTAVAAEEYMIRDKWGYCKTANYAESEHFVIFYGNNSWEYSPIGKIEGLTIDELKAALKAGQGNINITLSIN